jgi:hypothetical protein
LIKVRISQLTIFFRIYYIQIRMSYILYRAHARARELDRSQIAMQARAQVDSGPWTAGLWTCGLHTNTSTSLLASPSTVAV